MHQTFHQSTKSSGHEVQDPLYIITRVRKVIKINISVDQGIQKILIVTHLK